MSETETAPVAAEPTDKDADFTAFVVGRWARLVRTATLLGCSPADAEDLVQITLSRCYASWRRVSAADNVDAYVYRILINTWSRGRKRKWRGESPTADLPDPGIADATDLAVIRHDLTAALGRISPDHRTVLVLRFVADFTVPEIATVIGVADGTVKSRLSRAIDAIRAELEEEQP